MKVELTELEFLYIQEALVQDFYTQESMLKLVFNPADAIEYMVIRNSLKKKFKIKDEVSE